MLSVFVVEDEGLVGLNLQRQLRGAGYDVPPVAASADEALAGIDRHHPDVVLMDIHIRGNRDGIQAAQEIHDTSHTPLIFVTAHADKLTLDRARKTSPSGYLVKPVSFPSLTSSIEIAADRNRLAVGAAASSSGSLTSIQSPPLAMRDLSKAADASEMSQLFESLLTSVKDYAIFMLSPQGIVLTWNAGAERIKGYKASEIVGKHFSRFYTPEDIQRGHPQEELQRALVDGNYAEEGWRVRRDGSRFWASVILTPIFDKSGRHTGFSKVTHDITERKATDNALRKSERQFRLLADAIPHIVWIAQADGRSFYNNRRWYEFAGLPLPKVRTELPLRERWTTLVHPDEQDEALNSWMAAITSRTPFEGEYRLWDIQRQEYRWHIARALPLPTEDGEISRWFGTLTDIHLRKAAAEVLESEVSRRTIALSESLEQLRAKEESLQQSVVEKDVLLREIHHRVKNNLQIISSLLNMQAANLDNPIAAAMLRDSERRVMSMALIHEHLYGNEKMSAIDFSDYISKLVPMISASYGSEDLVHCRVDVQTTILTIEQAVPCSLILNELVTNALKYAYPGNKTGEVLVSLHSDETSAELRVADWGQGLPADFDFANTKSLGLQIIQILTRQLTGTLEIDRSTGTAFTIRFPKEQIH